MNPTAVLKELMGLKALPYMPNDEHVWNALVRLCGSMCSSIEQVRWLVARMTSGIYAQWPGPQEMRACFCCRYKPKDGISSFSQVYPDGLPPDPTAPPRSGIAAPDLKRLPDGHVATADPDLDRKIKLLAASKDMNVRAKKPRAPDPPGFKPLTQADIDAAVQANRDKRAREEAGL